MNEHWAYLLIGIEAMSEDARREPDEQSAQVVYAPRRLARAIRSRLRSRPSGSALLPAQPQPCDQTAA